MKINSTKAAVYFEDLKSGDVFYSKYDSDYCMKIERIEGMYDPYNSVILSSGLSTFFSDDEVVEKVDGEFTVK